MGRRTWAWAAAVTAGCTLTSNVDELTSGGPPGSAGDGAAALGGRGEGGNDGDAGALGDAGAGGNPSSGRGGTSAEGGAGGRGNAAGGDGDAGTGGAGGESAGANSTGGTSGVGGTTGSAGTAEAGASGTATGGSGSQTGPSAIYWLEHGSDGVWRAEADGSSPEELLAIDGGSSYFRSIALDPSTGVMYFSDDERGRIQRANFDGSDVEAIITDLDDPVGIDLDVNGGKLYFVDQGSPPGVFRSNLDGTSVEPLVTAGIDHPYGIALDAEASVMYFVDNGVDAVFRANLDGSALTNLGVNGLVAPIQIALDKDGGKIYWTDIGPPPLVRRANLDGTNAETVLSTSNYAPLSLPLGIEFDASGRHLYFVDELALRRCDLDGSGVVTLLEDRGNPVGLALAYR